MAEMPLSLMFLLWHHLLKGELFCFLIYAEFIKILAHSPARIRISTGLINGEHTGQCLQLVILSHKPNLIVNNSYLSQLFTQKRGTLNRFHKCWPEAVSKSSHNWGSYLCSSRWCFHRLPGKELSARYEWHYWHGGCTLLTHRKNHSFINGTLWNPSL